MSRHVVVFSCQWSPHYGFQSLYRRGRRGEGTSLRVMTTCIARVGEDLVLEAFRLGAEAVWVLCCPPDSCRHGLDHERFGSRFRSLRGIVATLGIPADRLVLRSCEPHEGERVAGELADFLSALPGEPA